MDPPKYTPMPLNKLTGRKGGELLLLWMTTRPARQSMQNGQCRLVAKAKLQCMSNINGPDIKRLGSGAYPVALCPDWKG